ncbi:putative flavin monooxygenase, FAD/NAD(P)-binding domain superfamily [Septoria linicola]|nr:putative flavin monooxygenase, FAD/NAD(P)-binding domain superfamily [Septoria linicola]
MAQTLNVRRVAVIGAGVSGVSAAIHLKRAGLDVTVYERGSRAGGVWVYDERTSKDPAYPSTLPSVGDSPEYDRIVGSQKISQRRHDSPLGSPGPEIVEAEDVDLSFAPPGPAYVVLKNNVSTIEMELSTQKWKPGTEEFVPHHVLGDYIQDTARENDVLESISFNTRVKQVEKSGKDWFVSIDRREGDVTSSSTERFDSVVVAAGHYHACNVPDLPGLAEWKERFPTRVQHSKLYRRPDAFKDQNVLLIGAGVSSMDIARDLGNARAVFQSSRGGPYDLPESMLLSNGARVDGLDKFELHDTSALAEDGSVRGTVTLHSGRKLCNIHQVIVCTGYHVSLPFMRQFHADGVAAEDASEEVIVTNGQVTHNLHKDIWYIPDPTLAFIGVPYHVATFSLFEFQAVALAQTLAGLVPLPSREAMRAEYDERLQRKGIGRNFHSLRAKGAEIAYVQELADYINGESATTGEPLMRAHAQSWIEAYARRGLRMEAVFAQVRESSLNEKALDLVSGC